MATTENSTGTQTGHMVAGKVVILYGNVKAISSDGTERALVVNSPIFAYDRVITASDGMVSIIIEDTGTQVDLGRMSDVIIDNDIFAAADAAEAAEAATEIEQIQELLLAEDFDPTTELEAPAAGGEASAGGGHPVPDFARVTHEGDVTSGAETTGITTTGVEPIPGATTPTINVTISPEGGEAIEGYPVTFEVLLDSVSFGDTIVTLNVYSKQGDTATPDIDYDATEGSGVQTYTVVIPAGQTSATFTVDTFEDAISENSETFTAKIIDVNNPAAIINIGTASATGTIIDDDAQPNVSIAVAEADAAGVTEGGTVTFTVTQDALSDSDTTVTVDLNDGTAQAPGDYIDNTYTVTIPAGSLTADLIVEVPTVDDSVDEPT
ncbi:MAG: retention module-containing protein, partial [Deltaproteobacteria bacterium]|nr:retention module-containing protein [Deltaproteobacteria bacterium]